MQTGVVILGSQVFSNEFPSAHAEVLPGVKWGLIEAFPSPAYWAYQAWANEQQTTPINYKLGSTLQEEVGACLLGGHGIPASVGLAAFSHLKGRGHSAGLCPLNKSSSLGYPSHSMSRDGQCATGLLDRRLATLAQLY
ncbi:hypothetical protein ACSEV3_20910 [Pseudomonas aeruginosa]